MISGNKTFFQKHWDWLVALGGLAVLAAVAAFKFVLVEDEAGQLPGIETRTGAVKVEKVSLAPFETVFDRVKAPQRIGEIAKTRESFLASGFRVFCVDAETGKGCGRPIEFGLEKCPYPDCGAKQKKDEKPTIDQDGDGLPDEWEKQYGLNPADPSDASGDLDNDGFTNMEEFEAGTDPSDSASHPDYLDSLKLVLPFKQTFTSLMFTGARKTPAGMKYDFRDPKHKTDTDRGNYYVLEGQKIGKTGFTMKSCETKVREIKMGGGMTRKEEYKIATVVRDRDSKVIQIRENSQKTPTDEQATLVYDRGGTKEFNVVKGQVIELNGSKYKIVNLVYDAKAKKGSVLVQNLSTGKNRSIESLE